MLLLLELVGEKEKQREEGEKEREREGELHIPPLFSGVSTVGVRWAES